MRIHRLLVIAVMLAGARADAALDDAGRCCATKLRSAGVREKQVLACHARAAAHGTAVDPACVAAAADALARQFARAEGQGGCAAVGDAALVNGDVSRAVGDVATLLRPVADASACAARKLKASGRLAQSLARAFALEAPRPTDHLTEIEAGTASLIARFQSKFTRLEAGGGCLTTGDADAVVQRISVGATAPTVVDGIFRTSLRLCEPACGDFVQGGTEQCDGYDSFSCPGSCTATCMCPVCGNGVKDQASETCDGADAAACQGLCQADCTCPTPVCGNGIKEAGEDCDGAALGACGSSCEPDCTCGPAVCGNGIVEQGEQCDGGVEACGLEGDPGAGCTATCGCCTSSYCSMFGCCDSADVCLPSPTFGFCFTSHCRPDHPCQSGYACTPISPTDSICVAQVGSACIYFSPIAPCAPPAVCPFSTTVSFCCLPPGEACASGTGCCSGTCSAGACS
jgi:hypothetical protein